MKFSMRSLFLIILGAAYLMAIGAAAKPADKGKLLAGVAEVDITPPVGYRMAGYYEERFSTGIHDPLKAKALVLQQGKEKIALVFCDLVGMSLPVTTNARAQASKRFGIKVSNISIFATHSHTGPQFHDVRSTFFHEDAIAKYGRDPHFTMDYPAVLIERLVAVIGEANAKLKPSELWVGIGQQEGLPFNRRYHMKNSRVAFNPGQLNPNIIGPAGPVDHDVGILLVGRGPGEFVGGLTVFAMHADTVGGTELSADYPYYIEQTLRGKMGPNYISMFGAGTCGDLNQIDVTIKGETKGQEVAKGLGEAIGQTVLKNVDHLQQIEKPRLAVRDERPIMPLQSTTPEKAAAAKAKFPLLNSDQMNFYEKVQITKDVDLAARGKEWPMEVQVYRLDNETAIVGLPAEIFVEFGLAIKQRSPFKKTLVIALNNDRPCYIPTLKAFKEGSYETVNSRLAPGTGEKLVEVAVDLLNQLAAGKSK